VVFSRALNPSEAEEVRGWLSQDEIEVFFDQPGFDQRHGLEAARYVADLVPHRQELVRAALLHDVGKRHAGLGLTARTLASAFIKLGGRSSGKIRTYADHGPGGAAELEARGVELIVIEFARTHHGERPISISEEDWDLLQAADRMRRKAEGGRRKQKPGGR